MSKISIVGAGQAGLQLAAGLLLDGHDVHLYSDRDEAALGSGRFPSSAGQFYTALRQQRDVGLDFWPGERVSNGFTFRVADGQGGKALEWACGAYGYIQCVDQRLKFPTWLAYLREQGAKVTIAEVDVAALDEIAAASDLTIVAAGKGDMAKLFEIDEEKSVYKSARRHIGLASVVGVEEVAQDHITLSLVPGVGEFVMLPGLTAYGPASFWVFEGVLDGPMDHWNEAKTPEQHLEMSLDLLRRYAPWDHERCKSVRLTDPNGYLSGKVRPTVRKPIGTLPSGRKVVGIADVVFLNDPVCGQGANSASKHATIFRHLIRQQQGKLYDDAFMQATFDELWATNQWAMHFTNAVISPAMPDHAFQLLGAAAQYPEVAHRFLGAYDDPADLAEWFADPVSAGRYMEAASIRSRVKQGISSGLTARQAVSQAPKWANV